MDSTPSWRSSLQTRKHAKFMAQVDGSSSEKPVAPPVPMLPKKQQGKKNSDCVRSPYFNRVRVCLLSEDELFSDDLIGSSLPARLRALKHSPPVVAFPALGTAGGTAGFSKDGRIWSDL